MKYLFRFMRWMVVNGNDELTDVWLIVLGIHHVLAALLKVFNTTDAFYLWMKCLKAADILFVIAFLMALFRVFKNLFIAIIVEADTIDEYLNVLEES